MADMAQGLRHQRAVLRDLRRRFELTLAHHGADAQAPVADRNAAQIGDAAEIDQMIDHDVAKVQHRYEGLAAGENLGVGQRRQKLSGLMELSRSVIVEWRRLHLPRYAM